ncbi:MAG TPA: COX15/CtaA family protein [Trueperaceae bacterium]|nr:COX15/CtaA family protein [Trueperaceae bacterium]
MDASFVNQVPVPVRASAGRFTIGLAWTALVANTVVIVQGAVVRLTGSGAGCGSHWPTCNGEVVPVGAGLETLIEFSHRLLSAGVLVLGVWLLVRALKVRGNKPGFAAFATAALVFLVIEALIGAGTVLLGLTGENTSVERGVWVAGHLVNSLLLIGALAGTVVYARDDAPRYPLRVSGQAGLFAVLATGIVATLVLSFTGGIAAMGNTIFPPDSLAEGLRADFDPSSHPLVRLRILHPLIAIAVGTYLFIGLGLAWLLKPVPAARGLARALLGVYLAQLLVGTANLSLLGPTVLQLLHLLLAVTAFALLTALTVTMLGGTMVRGSGPLWNRSAVEGA